MIKNLYRISDPFRAAGSYALVRHKAEHMPAAVYCQPADSADADVALILGGYRESVLGRDLLGVAEILKSKGFTTAGLEFGGLNNEDLSCPDDATQESHIEDTRAALSCFGDRNVAIFCTSNGLNSALQAMYPNVSRIVALNPFPNFIQERVQPIVDGARPAFQRYRDQLERDGFFVLRDRTKNQVKFTDAFIRSAIDYDAFSETFKTLRHKPRVTVINMEDDHIVEVLRVKGGDKPRLVSRWVEHMRGIGFDVDHTPLEGNDHTLTDPMFGALEKVL